VIRNPAEIDLPVFIPRRSRIIGNERRPALRVRNRRPSGND